MTEEYKQAITIAEQLENEIDLLGVASNYISILTITQYTASAIRNQIPKYVGSINPKWELYNNVVTIITNKLNEQ